MSDCIELTYNRLLRTWRWRYRSSNGRVVCHGNQAYSRRIDAVAAAAVVTGTRIRRDGETMTLWSDSRLLRVRLLKR